MPITDPALPLEILDVLESQGVQFAVLHREADLGDPVLDSDVDIVLDRPPDSLIREIQSTLDRAGIHPALRWPYDLGETTTYFMTRADGFDGAQIDFLHDLVGLGRYGVRSQELIADAVLGCRYQVPSPLDGSLYLLRKRWCKGDSTGIDTQLEHLSEVATRPEALGRIDRLFSASAARSMRVLVEGGHPGPERPRLRNFARRAGRTVNHVGVWAEIVGPPREAGKLAEDLRTRFSRWVILTACRARPEPTWIHPGWLADVWSARIRPGMFISFTEKRSHPRPDFSVRWTPDLTLDQAARALVRFMTERVV